MNGILDKSMVAIQIKSCIVYNTLNKLKGTNYGKLRITKNTR